MSCSFPILFTHTKVVPNNNHIKLVVDRSYPVTLGADAILERDGRLFRGKVSEGSDVWGIVTWELIRRS